MVTIAATQPARPDHAAVREAVAHGEFVVEEDYARDVVAGALGMSAMVLPGISGAYMLLILNRYEPILAAIALAKAYAGSMGRAGDAGAFLSVIVPTGVGALLSLVCLSNMLKWLLRHHEKTTVGVLLGILLGSVVGIWPFSAASTTTDVLVGAALAAAGFAATLLLSRVGA
jgi:putative membrane protein